MPFLLESPRSDSFLEKSQLPPFTQPIQNSCNLSIIHATITDFKQHIPKNISLLQNIVVISLKCNSEKGVDEKMTFRKHIEKRISAAKRKLMVLQNVLRNTRGPSPSICKWAYTGIVRPALTYGSIVWAKAVKSPDIQKKA